VYTRDEDPFIKGKERKDNRFFDDSSRGRRKRRSLTTKRISIKEERREA